MTALVDRLRSLAPSVRAELYKRIERDLGAGALADVRYDWEGFWARDDQIVSVAQLEKYSVILFGGPRGMGKTDAAVHTWVREIEAGRAERPRIFAATENDVDKTVVHGLSGVMNCYPKNRRPTFVKSDGGAGVLRFANGVEALCFSAAKWEQSISSAGDLDLLDDPAKWGPTGEKTYEQARISCRVGYATSLMSSTKRGLQFLRKVQKGEMSSVLVLRPPDLRANKYNLSAKNYRDLKAEFGGTLLFAQELDDEEVSAESPFAELNFDAPPIRILSAPLSDFDDIVVAVDPAEGKGGDHDEWGIGVAGRRSDGHVVALDDQSDSLDDGEAGARAIELCETWRASGIVVETNKGPRAMNAIRAAFYKRELDRRQSGGRKKPMPELIPVTAKEGKRLRASPLRRLYQQGMLHHVGGGGLAKLEKQQREWDPDAPRRPKSDDRIDWLVHAVHHLADLSALDEDHSEDFDGLIEAQARIPAPTFRQQEQPQRRAPARSDDDHDRV